MEDVHELAEKMGDHAAVYDSSGTLHVAYGGDHLYYARCSGGSCSVKTVGAWRLSIQIMERGIAADMESP